jgi:hypothetical protein
MVDVRQRWCVLVRQAPTQRFCATTEYGLPVQGEHSLDGTGTSSPA